jgi:hypothetical protein
MKVIKVLLLSTFLFILILIIRFSYTAYFMQDIQPDFTIPLSANQYYLIETKQNSPEYLVIFMLPLIFYYILVCLYIYKKYEGGKIIYLLPTYILFFDIYIYIYENEPMLNMYLFVLVEFLPIFISVFILYAFHKKL